VTRRRKYKYAASLSPRSLAHCTIFNCPIQDLNEQSRIQAFVADFDVTFLRQLPGKMALISESAFVSGSISDA
jgi:hypothetical protein